MKLIQQNQKVSKVNLGVSIDAEVEEKIKEIVKENKSTLSHVVNCIFREKLFNEKYFE